MATSFGWRRWTTCACGKAWNLTLDLSPSCGLVKNDPKSIFPISRNSKDKVSKSAKVVAGILGNLGILVAVMLMNTA